MKNILKIFKLDLHGLLTNFFALVIAGGLCALPALYAWFNIYANWDPYSNTGNIAIAVVNLDQGSLQEDGVNKNMGESLVEELKHKDSIGWVFLDSESEAVGQVKSGECYAALVIDEDFSNSMYNGIADSMANPKLTYYVNDKKNAVATKITDSAVSTVQLSINKQYVQVLAENVFVKTNDLSEKLKKGESIDNLIEELKEVKVNLDGYDQMISKFVTANNNLSQITESTKDGLEDSKTSIAAGIEALEEGQENLASTQTSFESYSVDVNNTLNTISKALENISKQIDEAGLEEDAKTLAEDVNAIKNDLSTLNETLNSLYSQLEKLVSTGASSSEISAVLTSISTIQKLISASGPSVDVDKTKNTVASATSTLKEALSSYESTVKQIQKMYINQIVPQVSNLLEQMSDTLDAVENLLESLSGTADGMKDVFGGVETTLDTMNISLGELQTIIKKASKSLEEVLEKIEGASETEQVQILLTFLGGDPNALGAFFASPVQMDAEYIYEIKNYGSGVAPFYTTLAIWVGMTILVSLLKVHADKSKLNSVKPYELYFGRYIIFFLLSQIQTLIIVLGDLYLLGVQCINPLAFWGAAAMTSFTFSLLVYSLTIAFGDIGKAAAVVVMVIQIAGSGGTYPIEALPTFFRTCYIFFPFPYAINAMRECIGGMYENDYYIYLSELFIFCVASLFIGLVVRIPFIGLNHFFEERMEDTEML